MQPDINENKELPLRFKFVETGDYYPNKFYWIDEFNKEYLLFEAFQYECSYENFVEFVNQRCDAIERVFNNPKFLPEFNYIDDIDDIGLYSSFKDLKRAFAFDFYESSLEPEKQKNKKEIAFTRINCKGSQIPHSVGTLRYIDAYDFDYESEDHTAPSVDLFLSPKSFLYQSVQEALKYGTVTMCIEEEDKECLGFYVDLKNVKLYFENDESNREVIAYLRTKGNDDVLWPYNTDFEDGYEVRLHNKNEIIDLIKKYSTYNPNLNVFENTEHLNTLKNNSNKLSLRDELTLNINDAINEDNQKQQNVSTYEKPINKITQNDNMRKDWFLL